MRYITLLTILLGGCFSSGVGYVNPLYADFDDDATPTPTPVDNTNDDNPNVPDNEVPDLDQDDDGFSFTEGQDCDDTDPAIHPGATDIPCDGVDQDCVGGDAMPSEGCDQTNGMDTDGDGSPRPYDCNDHNPDVYPGATDVECDGLDQDCTGIDYCPEPPTEAPPAGDDDDSAGNDPPENVDSDGDGVYDWLDCDDTDPAINQVQAEICDDEVDNNCDQEIDCYDEQCSSNPECPEEDVSDDDDSAEDDSGNTLGPFLPGEDDCTDGLDGEGDGAIDCNDGDCIWDPACDPGTVTAEFCWGDFPLQGQPWVWLSEEADFSPLILDEQVGPATAAPTAIPVGGQVTLSGLTYVTGGGVQIEGNITGGYLCMNEIEGDGLYSTSDIFFGGEAFQEAPEGSEIPAAGEYLVILNADNNGNGIVDDGCVAQVRHHMTYPTFGLGLEPACELNDTYSGLPN